MVLKGCSFLTSGSPKAQAADTRAGPKKLPPTVITCHEGVGGGADVPPEGVASSVGGQGSTPEWLVFTVGGSFSAVVRVAWLSTIRNPQVGELL